MADEILEVDLPAFEQGGAEQSRAVVDGLMRVQLDSGLPVFSASLTPQHFHEHDVHQRFFHEHLALKGVEAAQACAMTLAAHERLAPLAG